MRAIALSLAALFASGCASSIRIPDVSVVPAPLAVRWLWLDHGFLTVSLSEAAHVAVFEVVPGVGTSLLYPGPASPRFKQAGLATVALPAFVPGRFLYASYQFSTGQPKFYVVVASRRPLRVDGLFSASALRQGVGFTHATSFHPHETIDRVLEVLLPVQPDEDWAVDVYIAWPSLLLNPPRYVYLRCADGRITRVSFGESCPQFRSAQVATRPTAPPPEKVIRAGPPRVHPDPTPPRLADRLVERATLGDRHGSALRPVPARDVPDRRSEAPRVGPSRDAPPPREPAAAPRNPERAGGGNPNPSPKTPRID